MTEKEFENLKEGDKVFYITNWWDGTEEYKAYELEVKGKKTEKDGQKIVLTYCESGDKNCRCGGHNLDAGGVSLTKAEAWKAKIELVEERIKNKQDEICEEKEQLDRYKAELAKAKEEEMAWVVDFDEGVVIASDKKTWDWHAEHGFPLGERRHWFYHTEQEAYEALAEYYKGKYEEALVKSGKARFVINCGRICLATDITEFTGSYGFSNYDGLMSINDKGNFFPTRQEAEAELERRKK